MFVSSYNTYVQTNTSQKTTKESESSRESKSTLFSAKLHAKKSPHSLLQTHTQINHISQSQSQHNRQLIESQQKEFQTKEAKEFKKTNDTIKSFSTNATLQSAKSAYADNSKMFSLLKKPRATIDQTPKIDLSMPKEAQEMKELNMRHTMVNTYIANDNYYKITA